MYNFRRSQSKVQNSHPGMQPARYYYRPLNSLGSFGRGLGRFFPAIGPGASLFGLVRSVGVLLAILYILAPQYVAGLNPALVYWLSWGAMISIVFPLLRHIFVIAWSASGVVLWLVIVGVLFVNVSNPANYSLPSVFQWPAFIPNIFSAFSYKSSTDANYRNVTPASAFKYDRDGNQLRYVSFDDTEESREIPKKTVQSVKSRPTSSYTPSWLFSNRTLSATPSWVPKWFNSPSNQVDDLGYDYEALVKKYNQPSRSTSPFSWAAKRADDNYYFRKPEQPGVSGTTDKESIGGQVLGATGDIARVVEDLARKSF